MHTRLGILTIGLVAVTTSACGTNADQSGEERPAELEEAVRPLVETVVVHRTEFREFIELTGETAPIRSAVLTAEIPGRIVALDVEEGEPVEQGARVLRVDTATASSQRAQLETQAASLDRDIERARLLEERGLGTARDVEALETQRDLVRDQLQSVDVAITQGRTRSPIGGIVVEKLAEVGEYANPGVPLARIVDISTIVVAVGLPEREIRYVHDGMEVPVTIVATGDQFVGTLARIGVEAHPASRTFPLEIEIDNTSGNVRAGMRTLVTLPKRDYDQAVVIPRDAVLQGLEGPEVLIAVDDVVEQRDVRLGAGRGGFVVIESGLSGGESLIVRGHRLLVPGESIRTVDLGPCCGPQLQRFIDGGASAVEVADESRRGG